MDDEVPDKNDHEASAVPTPPGPILREWNTLSYLLSKIPEKAQKGFQTLDLCLTCIAALPDYLVLGTNVGLIYWYNRKCDTLERLKVEGTTCSITSISVVSSVDYMVAAGNEVGVINIFQIPKLLDQEGNLQETESLSHRRVQIYTVKDLHYCNISALEWSSNGMKLFSGDISGVIVVTEIDFCLTISKSSRLLDEKFKIVQLSYAHHNLLISTTFRSVLYTLDLKGSFTKLGSQDRKIQGQFGGTYEAGVWKKSRKMYVARPGARLWIVSLDGNVHKTIIFKDLLSKGTPKVPILSSGSVISKPQDSDIQIGKLFNFMQDYLVTFHRKNLYVVDPVNVSIIGTCLDMKSIIDVGVSQDEIFILETHRSIIRISAKPDESIPFMPIPNDISFRNVPDLVPSTIPDLKVPEQTLNFIASKFKETSLAIPKFNSSIINSIKSVLESDANIQDGIIADLPQIVPLRVQDNIPNITTTSTNGETQTSTETVERPDTNSRKFDKISNESYADALLKQYKPDTKRKKNRRSIKLPNSDAVSLSSQYSSNSEGEVCTENQRKVSTDSSNGTPLTRSTFETFRNDKIVNENELKAKEEMLAKLLNWAELSPDYVPTQGSTKSDRDLSVSDSSPRTEGAQLILPVLSETNSTSSLETIRPSSGNLEVTNQNQVQEQGVYSGSDSDEDLTEHQHLDSSLDDIYTKYKSFSSDQNSITSTTDFFGPPSGSSSRNVTEGYQSSVLESSIELTTEQSCRNPIPGSSIQDMSSEGSPCNQTENWIQYSLPSAVANLTTCDNYILCIDSKNIVYYSTLKEITLRWAKTDYLASHIAVTPDGSVLWRIDPKGSLQVLRSPSRNGPYSEDPETDWDSVCDSAIYCAIDYRSGFLVKADKTVHICQISQDTVLPSFEVLPCQWEISQVHTLRNCIWALTNDRRVLYRSGYLPESPFGDLWNELCLDIPPIASLSFGPSNSVWLADVHNNLHFINGVTEKCPGGSEHIWNVTINDVIFSPKPSCLPYSLANQLKQRLKDPLKSNLSFMQSPSAPLVSGSSVNIWFTLKNLNTVHVNKKSLLGHRWEVVPVFGSLKNLSWSEIFAESIYNSHGFLWLTDPRGKLCYLKAGKGRLQPIDTPCADLVHVASAPEALWVLSSKGKIYARCNMSSKNELGNGWDQIQLSPLENVQIVHMSCGSEVVWACDTKGKVYIRSGSLNPPSATDISPAWLQVEDSISSNFSIAMTKVYVGSNRHVVWAIDNKQNIYAREAIYPDLPIGTSWVLVPSIEAVSLAVSDTGVWALSPKGEIFRRYGVSETNFVGDCWRKIPGFAKVLTVSVCDELWALNSSGTLLKHHSELLAFDSTSIVTKNKLIDDEDTEWELV